MNRVLINSRSLPEIHDYCKGEGGGGGGGVWLSFYNPLQALRNPDIFLLFPFSVLSTLLCQSQQRACLFDPWIIGIPFCASSQMCTQRRVRACDWVSVRVRACVWMHVLSPTHSKTLSLSPSHTHTHTQRTHTHTHKPGTSVCLSVSLSLTHTQHTHSYIHTHTHTPGTTWRNLWMCPLVNLTHSHYNDVISHWNWQSPTRLHELLYLKPLFSSIRFKVNTKLMTSTTLAHQ